MSERRIDFTSGVNLEGKPFIHVAWGEMRAQMTPEAAVQHALGIIEVAQGALTDAFLVTFIRDKMALPIEQGVGILKDFREFREARVSTWQPPEKKTP